MRPGELATAGAHSPCSPPRAGTAFAEVSRRNGDYAVCGVAALAELDDGGRGQPGEGRLPVGRRDAAGARPDRGRRRPRSGRAAGEGAGRAAGDIHATAAYRRHLAGVLTERALTAAIAHARGRSKTRASPANALRELFDVRLTVNGVARDARVPARRLLSDCLRHDLRLTGTHVGCEHGVCGACTVLLDGVAGPVLPAAGGHRRRGAGHHRRGAGQAGRDAVGGPAGVRRLPRAAVRVLHAGFPDHDHGRAGGEPRPDDEEAREIIGGNLCRCTGYQNIVRAVLRAAELRRGPRTAMTVDVRRADRPGGGRQAAPRQRRLPR